MCQRATAVGPDSAKATRCAGLTLVAVTLTLLLLAGFAASPRGPFVGPTVRLKIDPNTASRGVLEAWPRIGPALSRRIIEARSESPILDADDLDRRVRGIGPATMEALLPYIRFDDRMDRPPATDHP